MPMCVFGSAPLAGACRHREKTQLKWEGERPGGRRPGIRLELTRHGGGDESFSYLLAKQGAVQWGLPRKGREVGQGRSIRMARRFLPPQASGFRSPQVGGGYIRIAGM